MTRITIRDFAFLTLGNLCGIAVCLLLVAL